MAALRLLCRSKNNACNASKKVDLPNSLGWESTVIPSPIWLRRARCPAKRRTLVNSMTHSLTSLPPG